MMLSSVLSSLSKKKCIPEAGWQPCDEQALMAIKQQHSNDKKKSRLQELLCNDFFLLNP
ncbi:MAG: hypothetical protein IPL35_04445 [Sphingobacteriales bacterium]|nr:hypothetical protein [Sphingobacteriales bacterium]